MNEARTSGSPPPGDGPDVSARQDITDLTETLQRREATLRQLAERAERHLDRLVEALPWPVAIVHGTHVVVANAHARRLREAGPDDPLTGDRAAALTEDDEALVDTAEGPMRVTARPIVWDDRVCRLVIAQPDPGAVLPADPPPPAPAAPAHAPRPGAAEGRGGTAVRWTPVVDLRTGRVHGYTAHTDTTDRTVASGVVVRATGALADWARSPGDPRGVAMIAVPGVDALDPSLVAFVDAVVRRSGAPADGLWVRIPSTTLPAGSVEAVGALRRTGVRVALDGFGRRGSPTHTLRSLPVDGVILDASLLRDGEWPVAASALSVARHLGLVTMTSGVRDPEEERRVRAAGCGWAEGPLYGGLVDTHTAGARLGTPGRQAGVAPA